MDFKIQQHCSSFFIGNRPGQDEAMAGPTGYQQTAESEYRDITCNVFTELNRGSLPTAARWFEQPIN